MQKTSGLIYQTARYIKCLFTFLHRVTYQLTLGVSSFLAGVWSIVKTILLSASLKSAVTSSPDLIR